MLTATQRTNTSSLLALDHPSGTVQPHHSSDTDLVEVETTLSFNSDPVTSTKIVLLKVKYSIHVSSIWRTIPTHPLPASTSSCHGDKNAFEECRLQKPLKWFYWIMGWLRHILTPTKTASSFFSRAKMTQWSQQICNVCSDLVVKRGVGMCNSTTAQLCLYILKTEMCMPCNKIFAIIHVKEKAIVRHQWEITCNVRNLFHERARDIKIWIYKFECLQSLQCCSGTKSTLK